MIRALVIAVAVLALAGCPPALMSQSAAPPSRSARLDEVNGFWGNQGYRLEISQGVAIAVTCMKAGPCEKLRVSSDDPHIAEVRSASLSKLETNAFTGRAQTASALVVIGKSPGKTTVRVNSLDGDREIWVTVVGPPIVAAIRPSAP